jgi:hypothetical protein
MVGGGSDGSLLSKVVLIGVVDFIRRGLKNREYYLKWWRLLTHLILFVATGLGFLIRCGGGGVGNGELFVETAFAVLGNATF